MWPMKTEDTAKNRTRKQIDREDSRACMINLLHVAKMCDGWEGERKSPMTVPEADLSP